MSQLEIDVKNSEFWNELCGSGLAHTLGITGFSPDDLKRFDQAYLRLYPYLKWYVRRENLSGKRVLEMGLGYGTLGQQLAEAGCQYYGLDIARNPVDVMRQRLTLLGQSHVEERVREGSALEIPYEDSFFDYVYSVGCLHHTGDLGRAISEVHRVLARGGKAIIMLYYKYSFRRLVKAPFLSLRGLLKDRTQTDLSRKVRAMHDTNLNGEAAPHTDYVSRYQVRKLFNKFAQVKIECRNFDTLVLLGGWVVIPREKLMETLARVGGINLYIYAVK